MSEIAKLWSGQLDPHVLLVFNASKEVLNAEGAISRQDPASEALTMRDEAERCLQASIGACETADE